LRELHLNCFLNSALGHHHGACRHPESEPARMLELDYYVRCAQLAEDACFDSLFFADTLQADLIGMKNVGDPLIVLAALAATTSHIGLIATVSTTFNEPYEIARRFATLDRLSGGRAGWNIVTSWSDGEAANFGQGLIMDHDERYRRSDEAIEVVKQLWSSWSHAAFVRDQVSGALVDSDGVCEIAYKGEYFSVRGPLDVPAGPQGFPLLVQAGSSPVGMDYAARHADAVFTVQPTLEDAQAFYADLKSRVERAGRSRDDVLVLPGLLPVLGATKSEARERAAGLGDLVDVNDGLAVLSDLLQIDLSACPLDEPVPPLPDARTVKGAQSRAQVVQDFVRRENPTLRDLVRMYATSRGHFAVVGTGEDVANVIQEWFEHDAADGFNVMPALLPSGIEEFAREVVPLLQDRALFRTSYTTTTLREQYGLALPELAPQGVSSQPRP
jgi:FMN-dependent oxidoreductase (nitrilotriacetate monooxygenase family)